MFVRIAARLVGLACFFALVLAANPAFAQDGETPFGRRDTLSIILNDKGLITFDSHYAVSVLQSSAIQAAGTYRDTYNAFYWDYQVLEAATIKGDGRRVPVPADKILLQAGQASVDALYFEVDNKTVTVIFPEVAVGDRVEARIRMTQKRLPLASGNSFGQSFPRHVRRDGAEMTIRAPKSLKLHLWQRDLVQETREEGADIIHKLIYTGRAFSARSTEMINPFDYEPAFLLSTFADWDAVAKDYLREGDAKADFSPAIEAKAKDITRFTYSDRARAEAIFNWVSANVRYVYIGLGTGGWVPHSADSILSNLYGDCKDHATLMTAMLRAVGVKVDYALVNATARYQPYTIPVGWFDHIILYLPGLDMYVDPTNRIGRFGAIDSRLQGKPVLRFNKDYANFSRIPQVTPEANKILLVSDVTITAEGAVSGASTLSAHGTASVLLEQRGAAMENAGLEPSAIKAMADQAQPGKGRYNVTGAGNKANPAKVTASFSLNSNVFDAGGEGIRLPSGPRILVRPQVRLQRLLREGRDFPFTCMPIHWEESYKIALPEAGTIRKLPQAVSIKSGEMSYEASYSLNGRVLSAKRVFIWAKTDLTCTLKSLTPLRAVIGAMNRDIMQARIGLDLPGRARREAESDATE